MNERMNELYFTRAVEKTRGLFAPSPRPGGKLLLAEDTMSHSMRSACTSTQTNPQWRVNQSVLGRCTHLGNVPDSQPLEQGRSEQTKVLGHVLLHQAKRQSSVPVSTSAGCFVQLCQHINRVFCSVMSHINRVFFSIMSTYQHGVFKKVMSAHQQGGFFPVMSAHQQVFFSLQLCHTSTGCFFNYVSTSTGCFFQLCQHINRVFFPSYVSISTGVFFSYVSTLTSVFFMLIVRGVQKCAGLSKMLIVDGVQECTYEDIYHRWCTRVYLWSCSL